MVVEAGGGAAVVAAAVFSHLATQLALLAQLAYIDGGTLGKQWEKCDSSTSQSLQRVVSRTYDDDHVLLLS